MFADDRNELKGNHPFDLTNNQGATILVVNDNFGCGSSREHAPQALMRWGIRAIIGQSFAEIFFGNCLALGIPCAIASENDLNSLQKAIEGDDQAIFELNLKSESLESKEYKWKIEIEPGALEMLTTGGWDATSQLTNRKNKIDKTIKQIPYLNNFKTKL